MYFNINVIVLSLLSLAGQFYKYYIGQDRFLVAFFDLDREFNLPNILKFWFFISALLYIGGALGFEMIGAYYAVTNGQENFTYTLITNFEEIMEMSGVLFLLRSLLRYMALNTEEVQMAVIEVDVMSGTQIPALRNQRRMQFPQC